MADFSEILKQLNGLEKFLKEDAKIVIAKTAVDHYTDNFDKQSFDGKKWKDVKRRDTNSSWLGFEYEAQTKKPSNHPSRKGAKKKYKPRKSKPITNYSPTARKRQILSSKKSGLENSIRYKIEANRIRIYSNKDYASIHNKGGKIKVFGKASVTMPQRQFIGRSVILEKKIIKILKEKLKLYL